VAAPAVGVGARIAVALLDDLLIWGLLALAIALFVLLLPILLPIFGFGAILSLFSGLSGVPQGGGPVPGGVPTTVAVGQIPAEQLALMQQVASSAPCQLPWTVLAAIADVESGFGKSADQASSAGAYGYGQFLQSTWQSYGNGVPWRTTDPTEQARPVDQRLDSTNFHYALPAMARYLCASGAGQDLRKAIFAYNHADWYVAEVIQLAAWFGGIGPTGDGLVDGWADRPPLNQYDRRNYASDQMWLTWRAVDCSAAALDWLLGAYGHALGSLDAAITLIGPGAGISTTLGLTDARGPALAQALNSQGLRPRTPGARPLGSIAELKAWLDQGPLLMDGAHWFGEGHWFVGIGYDQNGLYIRDSSGYDTRYVTWSRLYGEVGFSGWVVGVAPR
jgi:hypothetical protein